MSALERQRRKEHQDTAYDLQIRGGLEGAARWTVYGLIACTVGHYTWPLFRRQTLALKAFLTSGSTIYGLVSGADHYLLAYEASRRAEDNDIRRQARNALAREGRIATEGEIRKWRDDREKKDNVKKAEDAAALGMTMKSGQTGEALLNGDKGKSDGASAGVGAAAGATAGPGPAPGPR